MKAFTPRTIVGAVVILILLAALPGCQEAAKAPAAEPTQAPEIVLSEGECSFEFPEFSERVRGVERQEPVFGDVNRGHVIFGSMSCQGLWDNTWFVSVHDYLNADWTLVGSTADPHEWNSYFEFVPANGGAWQGWSHSSDYVTSYFTLEGDGELQGQRLEMEVNLETSKVKYRIVQVADMPVTETPETTGTVLAEGDTVCDYTINDGVPPRVREEPGLGEVERAELLAGDIDCPGMFEDTRMVVLNTLLSEDQPSGVSGEWTSFYEFIPEAGGAWLGTGYVDDGISYVVLEGDGVLEGQRMEYAHNVETRATTYRIVQVGEP